MIVPGEDDRIYLTPEAYDNASEARSRLALSRTPTGYFEIPAERLEDLSEPRRVRPHSGQPGGGTEQFVEHEVDVSGLQWKEIRP